ncbi:C2 domain and Protein kinase C-like, phorbol ester/diacylglycerol binding domain-containing protein [Strongyloides ratti]|uniref:C2 domain and Protein kinase C-like, phorbol ester/diacylglycerol binding domain-containing protein n=1 Tax=Strongyloides ratti TaxID=34506 RepID=A0A090MPS0_STRRB|nr:C2 domain and Protein kinase C-like, phorbol ester/diacylglycerol binding domain-containing protein [Strongyloides ratti]CEF60127.1 C2 domain and Protein kinase C-like, phorbol ester/diacylglycerol binding domain-containing protein [Strongyloides ratti]
MFDGVLWYLFQWIFLIALGYFGFYQLAYITADDESTNPEGRKLFDNKEGNISNENTQNNESLNTTKEKKQFLFNLTSSNDNHNHNNKTTIQNSNGSNLSTSSRNISDSSWTNELINWFFYNTHRVPKPLDCWINGLNEAARKINNPNKTEILFEGYGDHSNIYESPSLNNIRVESGPREQLTFKANIYVPGVIIKIVTSQNLNDKLLVASYDSHILHLSGEIEGRLASIANQLYFMGCFNGRPEFKIDLVNRDNTLQNTSIDKHNIEDAVRRCIILAVTNINLSDLNVSDNSEHFNDTATNISSMPVHEVVKRLYKSQIPTSIDNDNFQSNKLRVKIIRAQKLGYNKTVLQPYVIVEMDEPSRRYKTSNGINVNPYWEESFDFIVTPCSEEILFEVYEGDPSLCKTNQPNNSTILPNKDNQQEDDQLFLGLAIVGLDELRKSNESLHCLRLQGRPYKNDNVSGTLTVECQFYHDPTVKEIGEYHDEFIATDNNSGVTVKETVIVTKTPLSQNDDMNNQQIDITPTRTTTLTVKTISQQLKEKPLIKSVHGSLENAMDPVTSKALEDHLRNLNIDEIKRRMTPPADHVIISESDEYDIVHHHHQNNLTYIDNYKPTNKVKTIYSSDTMSRTMDNIMTNISTDKTRSSRGREKSGNVKEKRDNSFFGQLRDRLSGRRSKSKLRAKSVDYEKNQELEEDISLPPSREQSRTRYGSEFTRSFVETKSIGNESNISMEGNHESTIILELSQGNNHKQYFLIPQKIVNETAIQRLLKRGKKLHVSNDHIFVAVKIRGGTVCNVCKNKIAGSFSKQAYQCRDCRLVCHKKCHTKTISPCQQTNYHNLSIIKDVDWGHFFTTHHLEEFISPPGV